MANLDDIIIAAIEEQKKVLLKCASLDNWTEELFNEIVHRIDFINLMESGHDDLFNDSSLQQVFADARLTLNFQLDSVKRHLEDLELKKKIDEELTQENPQSSGIEIILNGIFKRLEALEQRQNPVAFNIPQRRIEK